MVASILYLSEEKVLKYIDWDSTFKAVKHAMESTQKKTQCVQAPRSITNVPNGVTLFTMPGYIKDGNKCGALACKLVTAAQKSESSSLPSIMANIALFDDISGQLLAILDGTEITKWRTAAASVVATEPFIKSQPGILAILGAGAQGKIHAIAFQHAFHFKEVHIWNRDQAKAEQVVLELNQAYPGTSFVLRNTVQECVHGADVIVTTTSSTEPILQLDWVKTGAHINAVGVGADGVYELEFKIYAAGPVWVDYLEAAQTEMANVINQGVSITGEIGEIISGVAQKPMNCRVTIFQSLGMAIEDCVVARMVYDKYLADKYKQ